MGAFTAFVVTAPTAFFAGWFLRGFRDQHRGMVVNAKTKSLLSRAADWLDRRLRVMVVLVAVAVLSSIVYTWSADQQSEDRTKDVIRCIADYVAGQSKAQAPRTLAANMATDARVDWDRGFSEDFPNATNAELKARYLYLADAAKRVRSDNPLPKFDQAFCREAAK